VLDLESPRELAIRTGWPERRIRNLISQRRLRHVRIGTNIYVPTGAVEEFINRNMVEPTVPPQQEVPL
jgi:excisionase family DNA binding protein